MKEFMLKATFLRKYRKPGTGNISWVFALSGTPDALKAYEEAQAKAGQPVHTDEATGKLLYFTAFPSGKSMELLVTESGKVVTSDDDLDMMQAQLASITDPALKAAFSNRIADYLMKKGGTSSMASAPVASEEEVSADTTADLS